MSISLIFAKIKNLTPVAIVGTAVLITIKLLTTQTPIIKDSLTVNAEEDIAKVSYEDEIKEPEIEEAAEEEAEVESPEREIEVQEAEATEESAGDSENQEQESSQEKQKQEKEKQKSRKFRTDISLGEVFQKLFSKKS